MVSHLDQFSGLNPKSLHNETSNVPPYLNH